MSRTIQHRRLDAVRYFLDEVDGFEGTADELIDLLAERDPALWKVGNRRAAFNTAVTASRKPDFVEANGFSVAYQRGSGKRWGASPRWVISRDANGVGYVGPMSSVSDGVNLTKCAFKNLIALFLEDPSPSAKKQLTQFLEAFEKSNELMVRDLRIELLTVGG